MNKPLTAYRIFLEDGTDYVTSMAAHVTPQMARDYFFGQKLNFGVSEDRILECVMVHTVRPPS